MGEVYHPRDTRLDREVAIKILPALFAGHPERRARFEREAKTLASLNHPHIAHVNGRRRFIVVTRGEPLRPSGMGTQAVLS